MMSSIVLFTLMTLYSQPMSYHKHSFQNKNDEKIYPKNADFTIFWSFWSQMRAYDDLWGIIKGA
jgi:hypothetical protein